MKHDGYVSVWVAFGDSLPGGFLLQPGNAGHVEHDSEEEEWLIAKLVQLLLEGFLQLHPTVGRGLGLSLEPQPEVMSLEPGGRDGGRVSVAQLGRGMEMRTEDEERREWRWKQRKDRMERDEEATEITWRDRRETWR